MRFTSIGRIGVVFNACQRGKYGDKLEDEKGPFKTSAGAEILRDC